MSVRLRQVAPVEHLEAKELAKRMIENGHIKKPGMFQICLGISWGQPATSEAMTYMRNLLPPGCTWFAFGISQWQFPMVAQAVLLGGHPRVGMEDNIYLEKGKLAPSNAALVEKIETIATKIYGASDITADSKVRTQIKKLQESGPRRDMVMAVKEEKTIGDVRILVDLLVIAGYVSLASGTFRSSGTTTSTSAAPTCSRAWFRAMTSGSTTTWTTTR